MTTKCIKLEVKFSTNNKIDKKTYFEELRKKQYDTYRACNTAMTMYYVDAMQDRIIKDAGLPKVEDKDLYGKTFRNYVEGQIKEIMHNPSSYIASEVNAFVISKFNTDKKNGLLKGDMSLASFKRDIPVMTRNEGYRILKQDKGYFLKFILFTKEEFESFGVEDYKRGDGILLEIVKPDSSRQSILDRIISKEYKQGNLKLQYNKRKNKWYALISFTFESTLPATANRDNILGVDLGISKVAFINVYNPVKNEYEKMYFKDRYIDGAELIKFRQKTEARRREYAIASKFASKNATGHGYKRRMQKYLEVGDKIKRFRDTANHKYSRWIVDMALKYNCGLIQMENLTGFSNAQEESLLRNWSYYDLQNKVKYKAKEVGIEVNLINPKYTSKRCSICGCIDSANRDCKAAQDKFKCVECGFEANADDNASRNICIPEIEKIINKEAKKRGLLV